MPTVVLVGRDVQLLETRAEVLKKAGINVSSCIGSQPVGLVMAEKPNIVALCHSLFEGEAESIADEVRKYCLSTKVLMILSDAGSAFLLQDTKFDAVSVSNPYRLIATVTELLGGSLPHPPRRMNGDGLTPLALGLHKDHQI